MYELIAFLAVVAPVKAKLWVERTYQYRRLTAASRRLHTVGLTWSKVLKLNPRNPIWGAEFSLLPAASGVSG